MVRSIFFAGSGASLGRAMVWIPSSTLALMSVALAGMYLIFHGHRKTGTVLSLLGTMAGFYPHPQMAYYVCFIFAAFGAAELYLAIVGKEVKKFCLNALLALATLSNRMERMALAGSPPLQALVQGASAQSRQREASSSICIDIRSYYSIFPFASSSFK